MPGRSQSLDTGSCDASQSELGWLSYSALLLSTRTLYYNMFCTLGDSGSPLVEASGGWVGYSIRTAILCFRLLKWAIPMSMPHLSSPFE